MIITKNCHIEAYYDAEDEQIRLRMCLTSAAPATNIGQLIYQISCDTILDTETKEAKIKFINKNNNEEIVNIKKPTNTVG